MPLQTAFTGSYRLSKKKLHKESNCAAARIDSGIGEGDESDIDQRLACNELVIVDGLDSLASLVTAKIISTGKPLIAELGRRPDQEQMERGQRIDQVSRRV